MSRLCLIGLVCLAIAMTAGCSSGGGATSTKHHADDDNDVSPDDDDDNDASPDDDDDSTPDDDDNDDSTPDDDDDNDDDDNDDDDNDNDNDDDDSSPDDDDDSTPDDDDDNDTLPTGMLVDDVGEGATDLALDASQHPRIAYHVPGVGLKYAAWNGSSWDKTVVDGGNGQMGAYVAIAMDGAGQYAYIAYQDGSAGTLNFAEETGGGWTLTTVDSAAGVGAWCAIAVDHHNADIYISYNDATNGALKIALRTGGLWSSETAVAGPSVGQYTSIGINSTGVAYASYYDAGAKALKMVTGDVGDWTVVPIDMPIGTLDFGQWSSLAIDADNHVHIAYQEASKLDLMYAYYDGSVTTTDVDGVGNKGNDACLMLDGSGNPHIVYQDGSNLSIDHAAWNGSSWDKSVLVDGTTLPGMFGFWMGCAWLGTQPAVSSIWENKGGLLITPPFVAKGR